jgi:hypothetical protein
VSSERERGRDAQRKKEGEMPNTARILLNDRNRELIISLEFMHRVTVTKHTEDVGAINLAQADLDDESVCRVGFGDTWAVNGG